MQSFIYNKMGFTIKKTKATDRFHYVILTTAHIYFGEEPTRIVLYVGWEWGRCCAEILYVLNFVSFLINSTHSCCNNRKVMSVLSLNHCLLSSESAKLINIPALLFNIRLSPFLKSAAILSKTFFFFFFLPLVTLLSFTKGSPNILIFCKISLTLIHFHCRKSCHCHYNCYLPPGLPVQINEKPVLFHSFQMNPKYPDCICRELSYIPYGNSGSVYESFSHVAVLSTFFVV